MSEPEELLRKLADLRQRTETVSKDTEKAYSRRIEILDNLSSQESRTDHKFTLVMLGAIMTELRSAADSICFLYDSLFSVMENQLRIGVAKSEQDVRMQEIGKSLSRLSKTYDEMKKKIEEAYEKRMKYFRDHE